MQVTENTALADVIHANYSVLAILNRFDIQLGFGNDSVEEICVKKNVNTDFFLEIVNSFMNENYFPEVELQSFPLELIIEYIKHSHDYYIDKKIPHIQQMISNLVNGASEQNKKQYKLIENFFTEYKAEFTEHIQKEEQDVHPYILAIDEAYRSNRNNNQIKELIKTQSISKYADDHENVEDKLFDLKNLLIKYLPPCEDYTLSNAILIELYRLERDLNDHSRIEEKVLIPKVESIEKHLMKGVL